MKWDKKTKTLTISWVDLEHIADEELVDNLEWEMDIHGINDVKVKDIKHIIVNAQDRIQIACSRCQGKNLATIFVKSKIENLKNIALCKDCWNAVINKGW